MQGIINNIPFNTETDLKYPIDLVSGSLYRIPSQDGFFYIYGYKPVGTLCTSEVVTRISVDCNVIEVEGEEDIIEEIKTPYEVTYWVTLLSIYDVIDLFIKEINGTEVLIKDSEFLLKHPIVTTGIAKVRLDNCIAHIQGKGFINITHANQGAVISNNSIDKAPFYKYGSRHTKEYFPENMEYHLKVNKSDRVMNSYTDNRGYIPTSCSKENAEKDVTIIIRGKNE